MKTKKGIVFGCYTDIAWKRQGCGKKGNGNSFVFRFPDEEVEQKFFQKYKHTNGKWKDLKKEFTKDLIKYKYH